MKLEVVIGIVSVILRAREPHAGQRAESAEAPQHSAGDSQLRLEAAHAGLERRRDAARSGRHVADRRGGAQVRGDPGEAEHSCAG